MIFIGLWHDMAEKDYTNSELFPTLYVEQLHRVFLVKKKFPWLLYLINVS